MRKFLLSFALLLALGPPASAACNERTGWCSTRSEAYAFAEVKRQEWYDRCIGYHPSNSCPHQSYCGVPKADTRPLLIVEGYLYGQHAVMVQCPWYGTPGVGGPITMGQGYFLVPQNPLNAVSAGNKTKCPGCGDAVGNPISAATGNKYQRETDFSDATSGRLDFWRSYNSDPAFQGGPMGAHWTHNFNRWIRNFGDAQATTTVYVERDDGQTVTFTRNGAGWSVQGTVADALSDLRNEAGARIGWSLKVAKDRRVETYGISGELQSVDFPDGYRQELTYALGLLMQVSDSSGRSLRFTYDPQRRLKSLTDPSGQVVAYAHDGASLLLQVQYPGGGIRSYSYWREQLTGITDENESLYATFSYDEWMRGSQTSHAGGVDAHAITYGDNGSSTITTPLGATNVRQFAVVQGEAKLVSLIESCTGCASRATSFTYDAKGYPNTVVSANGQISDSDYSADGLLTQIVRAKGTPEEQSETWTWDSTLRVPTQIDRAGQRQTFSHNSRGQVLAMSVFDTAPGQVDGRTTTLTYCEAAQVAAGICPRIGLLLAIDGPRTDISDITTYTYYPADDTTCVTAPTTCPHRKGDLWKVTNAAGQVSEVLAYDGAGRVLSAKDVNGVVTDMEYHPRGWLLARKVRGLDNGTETDDAITRLEYDGVGQVTKVIQADGAFTAFTYDAAHRLTTIADSLGNSVTYTLDNAGNRIEEKTKTTGGTLKRSLARVYNNLGQLQILADALATPTDFTYDLNGNVDTVKDALNRVSDNDYDPLNRLKTSIVNATGVAPDKATTQFQYDARDNLTTVIDPKGLATTYGYDGFDDLKTLVSPDTGTTSYGYDNAGNRTSQLDARGKYTTYAYDALNRLLSQSVPTAAQNVLFAYDTPPADCQTGETFGSGRLARITDESGSTRYCYDRLGHLVRKVQSVTSGPNLTVGTTYTSADRLAAMTYPSGAIVTYQRDANGQITGVSAKPTTSAAQVTLVSNVIYLPFGPLNTLTFGNGRVLTKAYDQNYGIDKVSDAATGGLSEDFTLDVVGNVNKIVERTTATATATRTFTYDGQDRLTALKNGTTVVQGFTYDATGNRLSKVLSGTTTTNTYDPASHRLTQVATVLRTYDANGNTTKNGTPAFTYDDRNRMRDYRANGTSVTRTYRYNGKGERVSKTVSAGNANNRYYTYDESGHLLGEYLANGARVQEYVWLDDTLVAVLSDHDSTTYQYVQTDHLGTPRAVINPVNDAIIWRWNLTNTAFGEHAATADPDANSVSYTFNMRYPGQWYDSESKLHYNYFRDYDPGVGRYIESDPIQLAGGLSTFAYAKSIPLQRKDQWGLVDVNYFPDSYFNWNDISDKADRRDSGPNVISVGVHSGVLGPRDANGVPISVDEMAKEIMKSPKFGRGAKYIELDGCHLGLGKFAQKLANKIGIPVVAPNQYVHFRSDGTIFLADARLEGDRFIPLQGTSGNWLLFSPNRTKALVLENWRP